MKYDPLGSLPDVPLTPEASDLLGRLRERIQELLAQSRRVPVAVLIWGPGIQSTSPLATVRLDLWRKLRNAGHAACLSEELCKPGSGYSIRLQELVQAQVFDLIVSLPCTPSAAAEIHDFATDRRISPKTLVFLNSTHMEAYAAKSLSAIDTIFSCRVEWYPNEQETSIIHEVTLKEVQKIQEWKYTTKERE